MYADWCALDKEGKIERVRAACKVLRERGIPITYGELAHEIGVTRGVIAGIYSRNAAEIGFTVEGTQGMSHKHFGTTQEEYRRQQAEYRRARAMRKRMRHIRPVLPAAIAAASDTDTRPREVCKPKLRVITNEKKAIEDFIAAHGVRRFERGDSGDIDAIMAFLRERGWVLKYHRMRCKLSRGRGRPRAVAWWQVIELVDKLRAAEGLEPILRRGTAA